jgi:hypothetical protein
MMLTVMIQIQVHRSDMCFYFCLYRYLASGLNYTPTEKLQQGASLDNLTGADRSRPLHHATFHKMAATILSCDKTVNHKQVPDKFGKMFQLIGNDRFDFPYTCNNIVMF